MKARSSRPSFRLFVALGCLLACPFAQAGSATWNLNPVDHDWNNPANWTPQTVPNGPTDVATFAQSNKTDLIFSATATEVAEIVFAPGASSFHIAVVAQEVNTNVTLTISGAGITNNSGVTQSLTAGPTIKGALGTINFLNSATAGEGTALAALGQYIPGSFGGSVINFYDTSSAGNASIYAEGAHAGIEAYGGEVNFYDNATAGNASCIVTGTFISGSYAAEINFFDNSTAENASFRVYGPKNGFFGGELTFHNNSTGGAAQLTILPGGAASVIGTLGSIAGNGSFSYSSGQSVSVGANNLSSVFRGTITGTNTGSLTKIGSGTLTLQGDSRYSGDTLVTEGTLVAANTTGSATGTGTVRVAGGTLGGGGTIAGAVVGTDSGSGAVLDPAAGKSRSVGLTIQSNLTMKSDATYRCTIDFKTGTATSVTVAGVTLSNGPMIALVSARAGTLAQGTVFRIIDNTGANPIGGTFGNLTDGAIVNLGGTNFQANYEGGDGNDLTLTVL